MQRLYGAAPSARVVYVDNDPLVLAHQRALQASSPGPTPAEVSCYGGAARKP
jgi:hypothetical protein